MASHVPAAGSTPAIPIGGSMELNHKAFSLVRMFEENLAQYTGAPFAVALNSGTAAIRLALKAWLRDAPVPLLSLPSHTYRSVLLSALELGYEVGFDETPWTRCYRFEPTNIWDCALILEEGMYRPGTVQCLSFHPQKPMALACGGGAILHDSEDLDQWYRWERWDGRQEGVPIQEDELRDGEHCYMFPAQAGDALHRLEVYATRPPVSIPHPDYEDLRSKYGTHS